jgi:hypothetical protein
MGSTNTELVDRYIAAVKFWLPEKLRDDIGAELAEDIRSEIDEAEEEKGRPLTQDEVAAILKARGKPMSVAASYQPQRHLIGPELFPLYIFVLKIVAVICVIPAALGWIFRPLDAFHEFNFPPFNSLLIAFAVVTIVFALIEHKGIAIDKKTAWNPKTLRPVIDTNRIKRSDSTGEIIGAVIGIGFYLAGFLSQTTYYFPSGASITVAPEWIPFWQIMIGLAVVELVLAAINLLKPYWTVLRVVTRLFVNLADAAAFCWLAQSHVVRATEGIHQPAAQQLMRISDLAAQYAVPFFAVIGLIVILQALVRLFRTLRPRPVAA